MMGTDTAHFGIVGVALADVYAMPKKGVQIDYIHGRYQITRSGGHVHWYWIKSGWIFRVGAAGYAALHIANSLLQNNVLVSVGKLGIAAGVFLVGGLLYLTYKPTIKLGKKYQLSFVNLST
jgi:hypothetical protein